MAQRGRPRKEPVKSAPVVEHPPVPEKEYIADKVINSIVDPMPGYAMAIYHDEHEPMVIDGKDWPKYHGEGWEKSQKYLKCFWRHDGINKWRKESK